MKRFAMTISLAACLVFLCGTVSMAANQIVAESKSVLPSATGVQCGVFITNDVDITGFVLPLEIRTLSGGAYMVAGGFVRDHTAAGRLANSPLGNADGGGAWPAANITRRTFAVNDPAVPNCTDNAGNGWNTAAALPDFISPDAVFHATVSTGDPNIGEPIVLAAGTDAPGNPSYRLVFNVGAAQGQFVIDTTCVRPANHLAFTDINTQPIAPAFTAGVITVEIPPNQCPAGLAAGPVPAASVGSPVSVPINSTDLEGDPRVYFASVGSVSGNDGSDTWSYTPTCADVPSFNVTIEVSDNQHAQGACQSVQFTVNVSPAQLQIACGNVSAHWAGSDASQQINVSGGCPPYVFAQQSGVGSTNGTGLWSFDQGCGDVGASQITIRATDATNAFVECTFTLTVSNTLPTCAAIGPTLAPQGVPTNIDLGDLAQVDGDALTYTYIGGLPGPWGASIVGDQFSATRPGGDGASYTVNYSISDGCASVNCSFDLIFENPCVAIVKEGTDSTYGQWLNGEHATVCVVAEPGSIPADAGGFDFLICYDQSGLSFLGADGGPDGWEYFTYRTGPFGGNCSGACPDGYVRLVSIAEMNNGSPVDPADFDINGEVLACMEFNITSDRNFINSCLHVGFCSFDCGDNVISDKSGDIVWTPRDGVNLGQYYTCEGNNKPGDSVAPLISYCPGAICIVEPPDDRGDLNLNGIANEIGDAVLYTNYFIYGSSVWNPVYVAVQQLASDINDDGIVLTVADLIYLIRIITGDEQPFPPGTGTGSPKVSPYANSVDVTNDVSNGAVTVRTNSSVDIGAALLVFRFDGTVGAPVLANNSGLQIRSNAANGELRVLVSQTVDAAGSRLTAGSNSLVTIPVNGNIELVESQFSDANGGLLSVNAASASIPTEYALLQNYPNPFNAGTVIPFTLTKESEYTVSIYNVAGQVVRTFTGMGAVGTNRLEWNGRTVGGDEAATGMYFYRVTTPEFTSTKKMVLIK